MADKSAIEWTNTTWNAVTGCDKVSPGCRNCYAERFALRLQKMGTKKYENGFKLTIHEDATNFPLKIKEPKMIFVNSMSDLFHKDIPLDFIIKIFNVIRKANWHRFQILTKRSERLKEFGRIYGKFPDNIWIGVSVENQYFKKRISDLKSIKAKVHFLSLEPLIGPIGSLELDNIEWVIAGGESGFNYRPCDINWVREIRDQCIEQGTPFFFKQWRGLTSKSKGRLLDRGIWNEFPDKNNIEIKPSNKQITLFG